MMYIFRIIIFVVVGFRLLLLPTVNSWGHDLKANGKKVKHRHLNDVFSTGKKNSSGNEIWIKWTELTEVEIEQANYIMRQSLLKFWKDRTKKTSTPTRVSNCHGMVFQKDKILVIDPTPFLSKCKKITSPNKVKPGDIVIYKRKVTIKQKEKNKKEKTVEKLIITHSGIVTKVQNKKIIVKSRWGTYGDYEHELDALPQGESFKIKWKWPPKKDKKISVKINDYGKVREFYRCKP